jgi:hypothetical protein
MRVLRRFYQWRPFRNEVEWSEADHYIRRTYQKHLVIGFVSFLIGARVAGLIFFDPKKYAELRENYEAEYWKLNGAPKNLAAELVPCVARDRQGQMCPTWIKINSDRERYLRKIDPAEFIVEELDDNGPNK